jgi:hypothetical protein
MPGHNDLWLGKRAPSAPLAAPWRGGAGQFYGLAATAAWAAFSSALARISTLAAYFTSLRVRAPSSSASARRTASIRRLISDFGFIAR